MINEQALNREPVPLKDVTVGIQVSREFENVKEKLKMLEVSGVFESESFLYIAENHIVVLWT